MILLIIGEHRCGKTTLICNLISRKPSLDYLYIGNVTDCKTIKPYLSSNSLLATSYDPEQLGSRHLILDTWHEIHKVYRNKNIRRLFKHKHKHVIISQTCIDMIPRNYLERVDYFCLLKGGCLHTTKIFENIINMVFDDMKFSDYEQKVGELQEYEYILIKVKEKTLEIKQCSTI